MGVSSTEYIAMLFDVEKLGLPDGEKNEDYV